MNWVYLFLSDGWHLWQIAVAKVIHLSKCSTNTLRTVSMYAKYPPVPAINSRVRGRQGVARAWPHSPLPAKCPRYPWLALNQFKLPPSCIAPRTTSGHLSASLSSALLWLPIRDLLSAKCRQRPRYDAVGLSSKKDSTCAGPREKMMFHNAAKMAFPIHTQLHMTHNHRVAQMQMSSRISDYSTLAERYLAGRMWHHHLIKRLCRPGIMH